VTASLAKTHAGAALRSKASHEWFTPVPIVEAARTVLRGHIEMDPSSCDLAQERIQAARYFTAEHNGLDAHWYGTVFLNPPGGLVREFWCKLAEHWRAGDVTAAIWIGYSLEQLQTLQRFEETPLDFPICFPRRRIAFDSIDGGRKSPTHGNYISCLPGRRVGTVQMFEEEFSQFGRVRL
jgi:hypothetical protein